MHFNSLFRKFGNQCAIIFILIIIIFLPRLIAGEFYLKEAERLELEKSFSDASLSFEDAANRLCWVRGLFERAAQSATLAGENELALDLFWEADFHDELSVHGKITMGDLLYKDAEYEQAIEVWKEVEKGFPESEQALVRIATAYRYWGNIQEAINEWLDITKKYPENDEAFYNLGLLLLTTQPTKALPELMQAARLNQELDGKVQVLRLGLNKAFLNDNPAYQLVISGQSLATIGEWGLAEITFLKAIKLENDYSVAWAWLGEAYQHTGKDGLPALKKALELDQNSPLIWALNGLYYHRQNQIELAWSTYTRAALLEPTNSAWQLALGDLSAQKGELEDALGFYNKAITLEPQDPNVWKGLALFSIQYDMQVNTLGLNAALQLMKLIPNDWQSYNIMGQVLMAGGNLDSAEAYLLKALKISSDQAEIYLHLGYLQLMQSKRNAAYTYLTYAYQLDPDGSIGWQAQKLIDQFFP